MTPPQPPDFESMFRPGVLFRIKDGDDDPGVDAVVEVRDAGTLHLATGRVIACEPLWVDTLDPFEAAFSVTVPPGRYLVAVCLARFDEPGDLTAPAAEGGPRRDSRSATSQLPGGSRPCGPATILWQSEPAISPDSG